MSKTDEVQQRWPIFLLVFALVGLAICGSFASVLGVWASLLVGSVSSLFIGVFSQERLAQALVGIGALCQFCLLFGAVADKIPILLLVLGFILSLEGFRRQAKRDSFQPRSARKFRYAQLALMGAGVPLLLSFSSLQFSDAFLRSALIVPLALGAIGVILAIEGLLYWGGELSPHKKSQAQPTL